jgi:2-oxoglutarate dehydrogenase E2 component (dihydrolipoamide succinyltransferase)
MSKSFEIRVPSLGESVTEATVSRWLKNVGDAVQIDETILELETDKVTLEVSAPETGVLHDVKFRKGSIVKIGNILGIIHGAATASHRAPEPTAPKNEFVLADAMEAPVYNTHHFEQAANTGTMQHLHDDGNLSPSARRAVFETGISPDKIQGTGKSGMVTKSDVLHYASPQAAQNFPKLDPFDLKHGSFEEHQSSKKEERQPMSRLRSRIAERLKEAQNTAAILTTFNEVDMSAIMELRTQYKDRFEKKHGIKLGFMSFFAKACVEALKRIPAVNAEIQGHEIIYKNYYDLGVAVAAPQGLVVPVLRNVDKLSLVDIEKGISLLGIKARDNKLSIEDLTGGTFTISNGGVFGSLLSTPILNPPQSGILGMHKIEDRPVAIKGRVEIRPMMYLAFSYDHRLVDGREAVTFLVMIKEYLENPGRFLLDI